MWGWIKDKGKRAGKWAYDHRRDIYRAYKVYRGWRKARSVGVGSIVDGLHVVAEDAARGIMREVPTGGSHRPTVQVKDLEEKEKREDFIRRSSR